MRLSTFRPANRVRSLITVSSLALGVAASSAVFAQDAPAPEDEVADEDVIVVSGYRAALENAQNIKEDADTFVDVITAEDIGALPDRSVAEALQRVPGVNISRFEQRNDPDRFSVEGSGVIIRGLNFVRSELNGRDIFSANGGRELSFNDVSPELLGRVEVFKNTTADMIDGGISGTVNLITRKPLDNPGLHIAGTAEVNVGDLANEWSPGFSILGSGTFESGIGSFGLQLGYTQQELVTRTDASQITDPCYRDQSLTGPCIRVRPVGSGGFGGDVQFDETNFPPANSVFVPKGAGVRTTDLTRDRQAYSAVAQFESNDRRLLITGEYLRAETEATLNEFAVLALVNDDALFPIIAPGTTPVFIGNQFGSGTLTQAGNGIPTELLRFQREDTAMTEDASIDIDFEVTDRLRLNFEGQYINSGRTEDGFISAMQTYTDIRIDNTGGTPLVEFLQPGTTGSPAGYFNDPAKTFYWFLIDNQVNNEGDLYTLRGDAEYDVSDDGLLRSVRFGARWSDRNRVTRSANFSNWGNLGAPWTGRGGNWNCGDYQAFGCGGAYVKDFPNSANVYNPFGDGFQRGNAPLPFGDGSAFFFGGDNLVQDYLSGAITQQAAAITAYTLTPNAWFPISARGNVVPGGPWTPGEISDVDEQTLAFYARADYETRLGEDVTLTGNVGLRFVETTVGAAGQIGYPTGEFFDQGAAGNNNGTVEVAELQAACANVQPGQVAPGYCSLSTARLAQFAAVFTGETVDDSADISFRHWLPSINARLDFGNGMLVRAAASRGISRPDLNAFQTGGAIFDNTTNLRQAGTLDTGPLFAINTGNRLLRPVASWNYDLSYEYYFNAVGSITASLFAKEITNLVNFGANVRSFTSPSGVTTDVLVNGPVNSDSGWLKGFEVAYQQVYDFLPGPLAGLGTQLTYTYVDGGSFANDKLGSEQSPFTGGLPLAGISKHTVNAVLFYEMAGFSARAAYNWRSDFLQTPRDVIFPFSPIYGESTGQLDASIFYDLTDNIKIGLQGVNLLDEVTRTSQVIDYNGTRATRSAFRNDRRYTFLVRFSY
ncbi:TonB-dependent receptor [Alteraurantiacibacter buctensis]|uniref:TonB-dependent receptor n=1 Tax=Alteraurantiacibacter buctensis TaxID=1503981 RepID=A0A844YVL0_9SPHN|nr:TonB-dependent receptor [Alteraurantiacibacter buctensis]MXO70948.1 TonB-dependent receptor [Alteraurantiacibacter buctensis]